MDTDYLKKVGLYILSALGAIGLIFYFGYHIWHSLTREVETQPVTKITTERTLEADGYIFRSEIPVYYTSSGGSVVPTAAEGEKINVGGSIAGVYSGSSPDVVSHIRELEDQIALLTSCKEGGVSASKDSASIDRDINSALSGIREAAGKGNALDAVALRPSLLGAVNKRALLTGSDTGIGADISALENEKKELVSRLGSCLENVYAEQSGYYYSTVDGYERIFDPSLLKDITFDETVQLLQSPAEAQTGRCAGKIVTSSVWYTVFKADRKYAGIFTAGEECSVKFKSNETTLKMDIESVLESGDEAVFILSTNYVPSGFDYTRVQGIELIETEYTGLRVPAGAVRIVDGETGVYILDGSTVRFRAISVLYRGDGICIADADPDGKAAEDGGEDETSDGTETVDTDEADSEDGESKTPWLRLHDTIIVSGKGLYDGRVIGT